MRIYLSKYGYLSLLLLIAVVTHFPWFDFSSLLFAWDWNPMPDDTSAELWPFGYGSYVNTFNLGQANVQIYLNAFYILWGLFESYSVGSKLVVMIPVAILSFISPFLLAKYLTNNKLVSFCAALFYAFLSPVLYTHLSHLFIASAYALAPLIVLSCINFFNNQTYKNALLLSLIYSIGAYFELRMLYAVTLVLFIFLLVYRDCIKVKNWKIYIFIAANVILLNLFWILPTMAQDRSTILEIANRGLFGNHLQNFRYALTNWNHYWTITEKAHDFSLQPVPYYWFFTLILIISPLVFLRERSLFVKTSKPILGFSLVLLLGILLTKQASPPFSGLYEWLYFNFPGFNLFREASKLHIITSIGYLGLSVYSIEILFTRFKEKKIILATIISLIFSINAWPLFNGSAGYLFSYKSEPIEYKKLTDYLRKQIDFTRSIWVPSGSKFGYYNSLHPKVTTAEMIESHWKFLTRFSPIDPNSNIGILKDSYSHLFLSASSIKNIILPDDVPSEEDQPFYYYGQRTNPNIREFYAKELSQVAYVKPVNLEFGKILVYENKDYRPYLSAVNSLVKVDSFTDLSSKYSFILNKYNREIDIYAPSLNTDIPSLELSLMYENAAVSSLENGSLIETGENDGNTQIYMNKSVATSYLERNLDNYVITKKTTSSLSVNDSSLIESGNDEVLYQGGLESLPSFMQVGSQIIKINDSSLLKSVELGLSGRLLTLFSVVGDSVISDASFEDGLWQEEVGDCNNYDDKGEVAQRFSENAYAGSRSLELQATRHIACTGLKDISVEAGKEYIFSLAYQSDNAKFAGYYLGMKEGEDGIISEKLPISGSEWATYYKRIKIPDEVSSISLALYSYDEDGVTPIKVRYDDVRLEKVSVIADIDPSRPATFEPVVAEIPTESTFKLSDSTVDMRNLFINSNFSNGLWNKTVGDCNNYDGNGAVSQGLVADARDGGQSLELVAARHIACTGPGPVPVTEESTYLLSFDYQSPNAKETGFYIGWGGTSADPVNERISVKDTGWHTYTKQITAPLGASSASLLVYAYEKDGVTPIRVRYDNFHFIELPEIKNRFYLLSDPELKFEKPKEVGFDLVNPTKKLAHIAGATTPFYLTMSEAYHPQWQAELNNGEVSGWLDSWIPWVQPDVIPEEYHFKLDGFLNGWYVDPVELCGPKENLKEGCSINDDGSYNIELIIEFTPQRWFYVGLIISGLTLASCLGYLGYSGIRSYRRRKALRQS